MPILGLRSIKMMDPDTGYIYCNDCCNPPFNVNNIVLKTCNGTLMTHTDREIEQVNPIIYPNPATELLHIKAPGNSDCESVEIYSLQGIKMCSKKYTGSDKFDVDLHGWTQGMYLVIVNYRSNQRSIKRFVKL